MIGTYGGVIFETSDERVLTPGSLKRTAGSSWATHKVAGAKPRTEYLAPALRKVTFTLKLVASLGVRPRAQLDRLAQLAEGREAFPLVIGGRPLAAGPMRLTAVSETWDTVYNGGELYAATVSVTLEEYA